MKCLSKRKSKRLAVKDGIALTSNGACQVINLSKGGLSLKFFHDLKLPHELIIDIYHETELYVKDLKVKKVWEKKTSNPARPLQHQLEIGGLFENLSSTQATLFDSYLLKLMGAEDYSDITSLKLD